MDAVLRAVAMYAILMLIFRITGKRSLAQITTFDFVLLLVVGEATQQALLGNDFSITVAVLVIVTLLLMDVGVDYLQQWFPRLEPVLDDVPLILVEEGAVIERHLKKSRISQGDIMEAAREKQGLERMEQIKYAVLERTGSISIIPRESTG
jgi:uncharacterized membrane protein YcaP (DUF421 family)